MVTLDKLTDVVELIVVTSIPDGMGGFTSSEASSGYIYSYVTVKGSAESIDHKTSLSSHIEVTTRKEVTVTKNNIIIWDGARYIIEYTEPIPGYEFKVITATYVS